MRGALRAEPYNRRHRGIIPAYAGSTSKQSDSLLNHGDHPRVCGEHKAVTAEAKANQGSSPRMRGARDGA